MSRSQSLIVQTLDLAVFNRGTASSGEALAVVFKGRDRSRGFGEEAYGASTTTFGFKMPDSLNIVLAVSTFQDRNGISYIDAWSRMWK